MARITVAAAIGMVLKHLGMGAAEADASPEFVDSIAVTMATVQRDLALGKRFLVEHHEVAHAATIGRRWFPLPDGEFSLRTTTWKGTGCNDGIPLAPGATSQLRSDEHGTPRYADRKLTTGVLSVDVAAGGTGFTNGAALVFTCTTDGGFPPEGYVTTEAGVITGAVITNPGGGLSGVTAVSVAGGTGATLTAVLGEVEALRLWPAPNTDGTLVIEWEPDAPADFTRDEAGVYSESLIMDGGIVALMTAALKAPGAPNPPTPPDALVAQAESLIDKLARSKKGRGRSFSLSPMQVRPSSWNEANRPRARGLTFRRR